jgi:hypothetical protein
MDLSAMTDMDAARWKGKCMDVLGVGLAFHIMNEYTEGGCARTAGMHKNCVNNSSSTSNTIRKFVDHVQEYKITLNCSCM